MKDWRFYRDLFIIIVCLILLSPKTWAWDSSSAYNTIAMSYTANTTITQIINLNSTQQSETTINFKVDVKNGGGRPTHDLNGNPLAYSTQTDSASITIYRYNSSGQLIGQTTSQTYILMNYGSSSNPGWSGAPGDNLHPFTQASVTYTGDLSQTAYIKIEMKGTDGAWWAGNYGAQWRTPTVTVGTATTNIVYNSEFGVAPNGVQAQGWTPSYGTWAACGVTSGNSTCVTQQSGVTANMWGGGYDVNGGTTSGTAGGYLGTLTSDNATQAASGTITPSSTPAPTVVSTVVTYTTRTSTSGNTTYVYRTPVTTTNYSDNTSTSTNGTEALYQTKVLTNVVTNKIENGVLTTYTKPVYRVTPADGGAVTLESAGAQTTSTQNVLPGLNAEVFRYDPKNYNCFIGLCAWDFTYHTPSTDRNNYGSPVNSYRTSNGMFFATNSNLPNNDNSLFGRNDGTVIRFRGTITAPTTATKPAGTVYRLYFYNNTDDGFVMRINGGTIINQNTTVTYQTLFSYTSSGWMDVVAGQTYNIEAWYWNTAGGLGHTLYWDYGDGMKAIGNDAFTNGTIGNIDIDLTGLNYSDPTLVNVSGSSIAGLNLCCGGSNAGFAANPQFVTRVETFQARPAMDSKVTITQIGNNNSATVIQSGTPNNYSEISVTGNYNTTNTTQSSTDFTATNYIELTVSGNSNTVNLTQQSDGGTKGILATVNNNNNSLTINQSGTGSHYAEITLNGGSKTVNLTQSGSAAHMANINLSGGATSLTATQSGSNQQFYSITHNCAQVSCAAITVTQGQ